MGACCISNFIMLSNSIRNISRASVSTRAATARLLSTTEDRQPVIVSAVRTPIGSFAGSLSSMTGPQLGAKAVSAAVSQAGHCGDHIEEVIMGNVVQAGAGQAPA